MEAPVRAVGPPSWDLDLVLRFLNSSTFESLASSSLRNLAKEVLFLIFLATAKRVGELQAVSWYVSFVASDACLSYVPEFVAKTESSSNPLPRSFLVMSLSDFTAGLEEELLLCPVRALCIYLSRTSSAANRPRHLFVSPCSPFRSMSKNGISYFLREVIHEAGASREVGVPVRAHNIRGISASTAFHKNWSVSSVLAAATCRFNSMFAAFYLKGLHFVFDGLLSLGPFVAAGEQIG